MPEEPSQTAATETRRLAAIMFTDIVGFSRQMGSSESVPPQSRFSMRVVTDSDAANRETS